MSVRGFLPYLEPRPEEKSHKKRGHKFDALFAACAGLIMFIELAGARSKNFLMLQLVIVLLPASTLNLDEAGDEMVPQGWDQEGAS